MIQTMIRHVRTTAELPAPIHVHTLADAAYHGDSLSAALGCLSRPHDTRLPESVIKYDPVSGFPSIDTHLSHVITSEDVARLIDEDE